MTFTKILLLAATFIMSSASYADISISCLEKIDKDATEQYISLCDENDPYYSYCLSFKNDGCSFGEIKPYTNENFSDSFTALLTSVEIACGNPSDFSVAIKWLYIADKDCKLSSEPLRTIGN